MPRAAISTGCVDRELPLEEIGPALVTLVIGRPAVLDSKEDMIREFNKSPDNLRKGILSCRGR